MSLVTVASFLPGRAKDLSAAPQTKYMGHLALQGQLNLWNYNDLHM